MRTCGRTTRVARCQCNLLSQRRRPRKSRGTVIPRRDYRRLVVQNPVVMRVPRDFPLRAPTHTGAQAHARQQLNDFIPLVILRKAGLQTPNGYRIFAPLATLGVPLATLAVRLTESPRDFPCATQATTKPPPPPRSWPRGHVKPPHRKWALSAVPAADALRAIRDHSREPISMRGERSNIFYRLCPIIRLALKVESNDGAARRLRRPIVINLATTDPHHHPAQGRVAKVGRPRLGGFELPPPAGAVATGIRLQVFALSPARGAAAVFSYLCGGTGGSPSFVRLATFLRHTKLFAPLPLGG